MGSTRIAVDGKPMGGQLTGERRGAGTHPRSWRICGVGVAPVSDSMPRTAQSARRGHRNVPCAMAKLHGKAWRPSRRPNSDFPWRLAFSPNLSARWCSAPSDGSDAQYIDHRARGESELGRPGPEVRARRLASRGVRLGTR
jgi:hypothetical protein